LNGGRCSRASAAACAAAALSIVLVVQGCGLEQIIVLNPPDYYDVSDGLDYFKVRIDGDNDELLEFRGLEIYYRFYALADTPNVLLGTQSELAAAGFRRLASIEDRLSFIEYPLVKVASGDRGKPSTITFDFSPLGLATPALPFLEAVPDVTGDGLTLAETEFRRGILATDNLHKRFYHETDSGLGFKGSDADIAHLGLGPGDHEVLIALYALSYGKQDLTTTVYSRAVPLQYITVTIHVVAL
jgi:hypothetical protein